MAACIRSFGFLSLTRLCLAGALAATLALPASAQLSRMLSDSNLTPEDIEIATATATELYSKAGVKVGETAQWSNEKTGASGVVEVTRVDTSPRCVSFVHTTEGKAKKRSQSASRRCLSADNTWLLSAD